MRGTYSLLALLVMVPLLVGCEQAYDIETFGSNGTRNASLQFDNDHDILDDEIIPVVPDNPSNSRDIACGNTGKHIMICHVPPGFPEARHTKCIAIQGAVHGHGLNLQKPGALGGHGGDFLGACP